MYFYIINIAAPLLQSTNKKKLKKCFRDNNYITLEWFYYMKFV